MRPRDDSDRSDRMRVERIEDPRLHRVASKGGGKGAAAAIQTPHQANIEPNTLRSRSTVRILEVLSEGPIAGLHTEHPDVSKILQSVFLDKTPVQDAAGNYQFALLESYFRNGYPGQDPVPGFALSEAEFAVGVEAHFGIPIVRNINVPMSAIRYKIRIPALYTQESDGDVVAASVAYAFDISVDSGAWTNMVTERVYGKTMSPYERAVRVNLPYTTGSIQIRIERIDPDSGTVDPNTANGLAWANYTEIEDGQISYDDTAIAALTVDAEQFPNVPQRAYLVDGLMVQIPSNYNGWTGGYTGDWNGTFHTDWTNNPAWILYALLTNERWGLGRLIDASRVDKWSFYEAARYNDELVADGKGGVERRFVCNCIINTRQDAYTVLQAVASNMNSLLYYAGGAIMVAQDRLQTTATRLFGPADVEGGLFDYAGADVRSRFTAAAITWIDPTDSYEPAVELVQDPDLVARQGYKETQATAFGCTSRGQAIRYGRWLLYTSQYETEMVTFRVGLENADIRPGDRIAISDPSRAGARLAGRLLANTTPNEITLDKLPHAIMAGASFWTIFITHGQADDPQYPVTIGGYPVVAVVNEAAGRLQISGKPAGGIAAGSMWLAASSAVEPTPWRAATVTDHGGGLYEILATEYHQEKFYYVDTGWTIPPPSFSLVPKGPLAAPSDMNYREYIYVDGSGAPQFGVVISWSASNDSRVTRYQLELSGPGGDYRRFSQVSGVAQDVLAMRQGEWSATLVAFDNIGRRSLPAGMIFTPIGLSEPPQSPSALYLTPQGALTTLTWVPTAELDVVYFWLKWAPQTDGSATWERATTGIARVDRNTTQVSTPTRAGTYMLKTIDSLGQESPSWAEAILLPQITERVFVRDQEEQPLWAGNRGAHWELHAGQLWLPPPDEPETIPAGIFPGDRGVTLNQTPTRVDVYGFAGGGFDLGVVSSVSMIGIVDAYGTFAGVTIATWVPLASAVPLAKGASKEWDGHIECQVSQDGSTFADWFPLKSTITTARAFRWRLVGTIYDLLTVMRTVRAAVVLDIPLRNIQADDVPLDGTGHLVVTYAVPFLATPTVQLTARQSLPPGGNVVVTESDSNHFAVQATGQFYFQLRAVDGTALPIATAKLPMQAPTVNVGGYWSSAAQRLTPPPGPLQINAQLAAVSNNNNAVITIALYKNGLEIMRGTANATSGSLMNGTINWTASANGTDYFEFFAMADRTGLTVAASGSAATGSGVGAPLAGVSIDYFVQGYGGHA